MKYYSLAKLYIKYMKSTIGAYFRDFANITEEEYGFFMDFINSFYCRHKSGQLTSFGKRCNFYINKVNNYIKDKYEQTN